jgi:hypothetical protein
MSRIQLVQIDVSKKEGSGMAARVVYEVEVTKGKILDTADKIFNSSCPTDMLNAYSVMHGACGAYLVDMYIHIPQSLQRSACSIELRVHFSVS